MQGVPDERAVLLDERPVEAKRTNRLLSLGGCRIGRDQDVDRIADGVDAGKDDHRRHEQDEQALGEAADDEDGHDSGSGRWLRRIRRRPLQDARR